MLALAVTLVILSTASAQEYSFHIDSIVVKKSRSADVDHNYLVWVVSGAAVVDPHSCIVDLGQQGGPGWPAYCYGPTLLAFNFKVDPTQPVDVDIGFAIVNSADGSNVYGA